MERVACRLECVPVCSMKMSFGFKGGAYVYCQDDREVI